MSRWVWIAAAVMLVGCAGSGYRYEDDGYWYAPPRQSTLVVSVGWGACGGWGSPFGYPHYGYGWSSCGYGYGYGPGWHGAGLGYWRDPYWSQPWYLPPRTIGPLPAGSRARNLANQPIEDLAGYQRYEDLATSRRRDLGGGVGAYRSGARGGSYYAPVMVPSPRGGIGSGTRGPAQYYPAPSQGLSAGRFDTAPSPSASSSRSSFDRSNSSSPRSGGYDSPRSAGSAARSMARESREED